VSIKTDKSHVISPLPIDISVGLQVYQHIIDFDPFGNFPKASKPVSSGGAAGMFFGGLTLGFLLSLLAGRLQLRHWVRKGMVLKVASQYGGYGYAEHASESLSLTGRRKGCLVKEMQVRAVSSKDLERQSIVESQETAVGGSCGYERRREVFVIY